jgi:diguanylate cyclase (GGDEF)-like protein
MLRNWPDTAVASDSRAAQDAHAPVIVVPQGGPSLRDVQTARSESISEAIARTEHLLLARQTERLLTAFENIRDGLAIFDRDKRLVMTNRRYLEMYGFPEELQRPGMPAKVLQDYLENTGFLVGPTPFDLSAWTDPSETGNEIQLYTSTGRIYQVFRDPLPTGGWVSTHEDITDRVAAEEQIRFMAERDTLTGLYNHATFQERVAHFLKVAKDGGPNCAFALLMLDINKFRAINEIHGHSAGDAVLIEVAGRLRKVVGDEAVLARLGGDQFALIIDFPNPQVVADIANLLLVTMKEPIRLQGSKLAISASIGVCFGPQHGNEASQLLKAAERATHAAQHLSMGPYVIYDAALDAEEIARAHLIRALPEAIATGQLELHFQPIIDAATGRCRSAEALLRWTHPELGRISPEATIAAAEESRLIGELGAWIVERALAAAATWPDDVTVAVNLSAIQLRDAGFVKRVNASLEAFGVRPQRLELELTETVLCSDEAVETIRALREEGVRFSLDDFGTGYASMSYLIRFPFDRVKIDRSFVTDVHLRRDRRLIVEAVAGLAAKLGLEIVAEGVESEAERQVVQSAGCTFLQGYLFSKPLPEKAFSAFLKDNAACNPGTPRALLARIV